MTDCISASAVFDAQNARTHEYDVRAAVAAVVSDERLVERCNFVRSIYVYNRRSNRIRQPGNRKYKGAFAIRCQRNVL